MSEQEDMKVNWRPVTGYASIFGGLAAVSLAVLGWQGAADWEAEAFDIATYECSAILRAADRGALERGSPLCQCVGVRVANQRPNPLAYLMEDMRDREAREFARDTFEQCDADHGGETG